MSDVKSWSAAIQKCCSDGDAEVRDNAVRIIAVISQCLGEAAVPSLFPEVHSDNLKMKKVSFFLLQNSSSRWKKYRQK